MSRAAELFSLDRPGFRRVADFASRASEWLVLAYLLLAVTPPILFHHHALTVIPHLNLLDGSWQLDTTYKASGGIWFGRDVAFTYGPIYQWLSSAPARWIGVSAGSVLATADTLPVYLAILSTFATTWLLLPEAAPWRRALLVLLAVVFWSPLDLRVSLCLLAFAVFVRLCHGAADRGAAVAIRGFLAAAFCAAAFLVSADTGLYCAATLLVCIAATAVTRDAWRRMAPLLMSVVACGAAVVFAINAAMFSARNFSYWKSSLAIAAGYRWFEPLAMAKPDRHVILATLMLGVTVFVVAAVWRRSRRDWSARPAFLLGGFFTALILMQSALLRSDRGHVVMGIYPMIFLCGVIVLNRFRRGPWFEAGSAIVLLAITVGAAQPVGAFRPGNVLAQIKQLRRPVLSCPDGSQVMDGACFSAPEAQWMGAVSSFVRGEAAPGAQMAVFPYETAFGLLTRHQVSGGLMQGYLANGQYLTNLELEGLRAVEPSVGLYFADKLVSQVLDGVPNFTRSPEIWLYYARHFRQERQLATGVSGLLRDDGREGRMGLSVEGVGKAFPSAAVRHRSTIFDLGQVRWPAEGADFLKLHVRVDYPFWWQVRKPSCYTLQMGFADGSQRSIQFVVEPGRDTEVWVYPWDDETLASYFSADETQWRPPNRTAVTSLKLLITPHDWISVVPKSVAVESIEAVRVDFQ